MWPNVTKPVIIVTVVTSQCSCCINSSTYSSVLSCSSVSSQWGRMYPSGPEFTSNRIWKPLEWISGESVILNTDLKPIPFWPDCTYIKTIKPWKIFIDTTTNIWNHFQTLTILQEYMQSLNTQSMPTLHWSTMLCVLTRTHLTSQAYLPPAIRSHWLHHSFTHSTSGNRNTDILMDTSAYPMGNRISFDR